MPRQELYLRKSYITAGEPMDTIVNTEAMGIQTNSVENGTALITKGTTLHCEIYFHSC
jgi:hypothetical protein